jgi:Mce-associated membrane protein
MPMTRPPAEVAAQNQQTGYRLRVKMTPADGRYKISKLDQVAK